MNVALTTERPTTEGADVSIRYETLDMDAAASFAEAWDALAQRLPANPQSSHAWLAPWWRAYGGSRQARIVAAFRGDALAGVVPLYVDTFRASGLGARVARLMGADSTLALVDAPAEPQIRDALWRRSIEVAFDECDCDLLCLGPTDPDFTGAAPALEAAQQRGMNVAWRREVERQTFVPLGDSIDDVLAALGRDERKSYRRRLRRLTEEHDATVEVLTARDECLEALEQFMPMHQAQWQARGARGHFGDWPGSSDFHRAIVASLCERGMCCFVRVTAGGKPIAFQYGVVAGGRAIGLLTARAMDETWDRYGLGHVTLFAFFEHAIARGARIADLGRGEYDYKLRMGGEQRPIESIGLVRPGAISKLRSAALRVASDAINKAYYRAWYCRLAPTYGGASRSLSPLWIRTRI